MNVAYVRVSTADQNMDRQISLLEKYQIDKWYMEKVSGKNMDREQLKMLLDYVRDGDQIYITDFSRISRNVADLLEIVETLNKKNVRLISLKENLDTSTPTGKLMLTMIGAIAEFERQNILERQRDGIAIAKQKGLYKGRKKKDLSNFENVYREWKDKKITAVCAAEILEISRATFYSRIKQYEKN